MQCDEEEQQDEMPKSFSRDCPIQTRGVTICTKEIVSRRQRIDPTKPTIDEA